jgi:hypothetical protein
VAIQGARHSTTGNQTELELNRFMADQPLNPTAELALDEFGCEDLDAQ